MQKTELVPCDDPLAELLGSSPPPVSPPPASPSAVPVASSSANQSRRSSLSEKSDRQPLISKAVSSDALSGGGAIVYQPSGKPAFHGSSSSGDLLSEVKDSIAGNNSNVPNAFNDRLAGFEEDQGEVNLHSVEEGDDWSDCEGSSIGDFGGEVPPFRLHHLWSKNRSVAASSEPKRLGDKQSDLGYLPGEESQMKIPQTTFVSLTGRMTEGLFHMTNFRMHFTPVREGDPSLKKRNLSVPLTCVEKMEWANKKNAEVTTGKVLFTTRDGRQITFIFPRNLVGKVLECLDNFCFPSSFDQFFAFDYYNSWKNGGALPDPIPEHYDGWKIYDPIAEYRRQGLLSEPASKGYFVTDINAAHKICQTYPPYICLPRGIDPQEIVQVALFRSRGRIPTLTWKHPKSSATLWRCSQPKVGINAARSTEDEKLFRLLSLHNLDNHNIYIADARPKLNAMGNKLTGAGYEMVEFYPNTEIEFMNIQNIHSMRDAYQKMSKACNRVVTGVSVTEASVNHYNWYSSVESSQWLYHIAEVLKATFLMVYKLDAQKATVVSHCSDGWDRTAQLCSLVELCMDPYFRTIRGLFILIEKEWLSFGHKFHERLGYGERNAADDQRSPIFVQWVECLWQLTEQFPTAFEFNSRLLVTLLDEIFSCRFGTFLLNSLLSRESYSIPKRTFSLWTYFFTCHERGLFVNPFYDGTMRKGSDVVLYPTYNMKKINVWEDYWYRWLPSETLHGGIGGGSIFRHSEHCQATSADVKLQAMHRRLKKKIRQLQRQQIGSVGLNELKESPEETKEDPGEEQLIPGEASPTAEQPDELIDVKL
jgi:myotubularin-related protein 1/2